MTVPRVLVGRYQRRSLQYKVGKALHIRDLLTILDEKRLDITSSPAKRNVIMVRIGERRRAFYIKWDFMLRKISSKSKLHRHTCHNATQALICGATHAVIRVSQ